MSRTIKSLGHSMNDIRSQKGANQKSTSFFDSDFKNKPLSETFPETGFPWVVDEYNEFGQTVINEEHQYFIQKDKRNNNKIDQYIDSGGVYRDFPDPVSIDTTTPTGTLKIRCQRTSPEMEDFALGIVDVYKIMDVDYANKKILVEGVEYSYVDPTIYSTVTNTDGQPDFINNRINAEQRFGINRYLRDNVNSDAPGHNITSSYFYKKMYQYGLSEIRFFEFDTQRTEHRFKVQYTNIVDTNDKPMSNANKDETFEITLQKDDQRNNANADQEASDSFDLFFNTFQSASVPTDGKRPLLILYRRMPYISGMLSSRYGVNGNLKYGSWHMRLKMPSGRGSFAALWSWPQYDERDGPQEDEGLTRAQKGVEVDFIEQLGHTPIQYHNLHQPDGTLFDRNDVPRIFNSTNAVDTPIENRNGTSGLGGEVDYKDASGSKINSPTLEGPEWSANEIQQHQVLLTNGPDRKDFTDWQELIWDWYEDNTCAWFVNYGTSENPDFREVAHASMSPLAEERARTFFINNSYDSNFNRSQEANDINAPFTSQLPEPWDLEVDYVKIYEWDDVSGSTGSTSDFTVSGLTITFENTQWYLIRDAAGNELTQGAGQSPGFDPWVAPTSGNYTVENLNTQTSSPVTLVDSGASSSGTTSDFTVSGLTITFENQQWYLIRDTGGSELAQGAGQSPGFDPWVAPTSGNYTVENLNTGTSSPVTLVM